LDVPTRIIDFEIVIGPFLKEKALQLTMNKEAAKHICSGKAHMKASKRAGGRLTTVALQFSNKAKCNIMVFLMIKIGPVFMD
jgi:hypothetical protein